VRIRVKETKNIFKINLNFGRQHFLAAFDTEFGVIKTRFRIPLSIGAKKIQLMAWQPKNRRV
jgi:hypothetical protein